MKITRNDFLVIAKKPYDYTNPNRIDNIDYNRWVDFIESHSEYFIWYEDTPDGKNALENIDEVPDWAKERVLYSLNKKEVLATRLLAKNPRDLVVSYSDSDKMVNISREKNLNKSVAKFFLEMAKYLDALLIKDGKKIIDEKVIEELSE